MELSLCMARGRVQVSLRVAVCLELCSDEQSVRGDAGETCESVGFW